jgi:hypothetical protein
MQVAFIVDVPDEHAPRIVVGVREFLNELARGFPGTALARVEAAQPAKATASFSGDLVSKLKSVLIEFVGLIGFLLILFVGQRLSHVLFGDYRVWGRFPLEYVFDLGHVALVVCFSTRACIKLFRD